ncbi:hypothetical protein [Paraburkholderia sp. Ac-20347]|uniref:hypothetical protein n=1 Tax=Paraburkholderia sp. Ac-20347 TaxID=2703892 RepID=UPI00197ECEF2|nr:hypothetical protein [Paraburkholderia sp. Ac-20347]MBN3814088.1 hypothetical protein [Paraburkholderia sp. Ac-20347]
MKKITLHPAAFVGVLLLAAVAAAAVTDHTAFKRGYTRGTFDAQHDAIRNIGVGLSTMMTSGITIRQADGSERRFVLTPVETQSH